MLIILDYVWENGYICNMWVSCVRVMPVARVFGTGTQQH